MKIAVGLSGGVDSTITLYLLKKQGHEVIGLTMKIWDNNKDRTYKRSACFGPDEVEDIEDVKKITKQFGVPFYEIDLSKEYIDNILGYFKDEYSSGRTPNPCVRCNQTMKFDMLLQKAFEHGIKFDKFATGHYANVEYDENSKRYLLKKGIDEKKDQSYFLTLLSQEQLSRVIFPLGNYKKQDIKKMSKDIGLKVHEKKESQDFYSGDYEELLDKLPVKGNIVDLSGRTLGKHKGICFYTIGQRKGLGVSHSEPLYVIDIDRSKNEVVVGTEKDLFRKKFIVERLNWIAIPGINERLSLKTRIRYLHKEADSIIIPQPDNKVLIEFYEAQKAIAPGQFAVFYDDDIVVGGGVIEKVIE